MRARLELATGVLLISAGLALGVFFVSPMIGHLSNDPRSPIRDQHRGLIIRDNCHGTVCYISNKNAERERQLFWLGPITVLLIFSGFILVKRAA